MTKIKITNLVSVASIIICVGIIAMMILPNESFAASTTTPTQAAAGNGDSISNALCNILGLLQGTAGQAIASIGVVVLGVGIFLGKISWPLAVATALGIALIFGAGTIVTMITANNSGASMECANPSTT